MVDYGAHLGGAIGGGGAALLLLALWPNGPKSRTAAAGRPRLAFLAMLVAIVGVAGAAYGATRVPRDHKLQSYAVLLFPRDRLPATEDAAKAAAVALIGTYPRDPRGHFYQALALIDAKNLSAAEDELRTALGEGELLKLLFKPYFGSFKTLFLHCSNFHFDITRIPAHFSRVSSKSFRHDAEGSEKCPEIAQKRVNLLRITLEKSTN